QYDPTGLLAGRTPEERATVNQWLSWQISGLGPYQGQLLSFLLFHQDAHGEKSGEGVIARYQQEVERLRGVLENQLASAASGGYIALGRLTIVDFAILLWLKSSVLAREALRKREMYPAITGYLERLEGLEVVREAYRRAAP
ncbi:glutathione S-transferase family protein, partial [Aspergillus homomorphus CBS 101889]